MISTGLSTNERIKRSDILAAISKEIPRLEGEKKKLKETEASKITEEEKNAKLKELEEKIQLFKSDQDTLKRMTSQGFWSNMKVIFKS